MKKVLTFIFSAILALSATGFECAAQKYVAPAVTISTTKVERGGKLYYEHKVIEKQTLYSISKAYDVYIDEIYAANEGLKENGLKKGSVIYIPVKGGDGGSAEGSTGGAEGSSDGTTGGSGSSNGTTGEAGSSDGTTGGAGFSGGTTGGADGSDGSSTYGVSGENTANSASLSAENSGKTANSGKNTANSRKNGANSASLSANGKNSANGSDTSEKVKKSAAEPTEFEKKSAEKKADRKAEKEKRKNFTTHTVKWYETIEDISEKYGVSVAVIMEVNELTDRELKPRQKLLIPNSPEEYASEGSEAEETVVETPVDSALAEAEDLSKIKKKRPDFLNKNDICATLLLPFNALAGEGNDLSMDFYSGALLAAKHLSEDSGISLYINVFDCYGNVLPDEKDLSYSDFVVGLLSKDGFDELLGYVPKDCRVVSPLDTGTLPLTETYSNFYQCSNSTAAQYADMAQWLVEEMEEGDRILVIHENSLAGTDQAGEIGEALNACALEWSTFSYSILDGRNITSSLGKQMTKDGVNRVIIVTSNEAFANDAIRNLNVLLHSDFDIVLYGGSKIRGFENIPVENLHNIKFHTSQSFFIDYDDARVQKFLMEYRALYNTEPSQTAFQGYDVIYYFTTMTRRVGAMHLVERPKDTPMLMSDFEFEKCGDEGGYVRTGIRRTVYEPNYSITYLK